MIENETEYEKLIQNYVVVAKNKAEEYPEEDYSHEDLLEEAVKLNVQPSEQLEPVEMAQIYFNLCKYNESDLPINWRNYPVNPDDPLRENLEFLVDRVVWMEVLDELGVEV